MHLNPRLTAVYNRPPSDENVFLIGWEAPIALRRESHLLARIQALHDLHLCSSSSATSLVGTELLAVSTDTWCAFFTPKLFAGNSILLQISFLSFRSHLNFVLWKACLALQGWINCHTGLVAAIELC